MHLDLLRGSSHVGKADGWYFDAQCEAAWKLGQWDTAPMNQQSSGSTQKSFNSTICNCLKVMYIIQMLHVRCKLDW